MVVTIETIRFRDYTKIFGRCGVIYYIIFLTIDGMVTPYSDSGSQPTFRGATVCRKLTVGVPQKWTFS